MPIKYKISLLKAQVSKVGLITLKDHVIPNVSRAEHLLTFCKEV